MLLLVFIKLWDDILSKIGHSLKLRSIFDTNILSLGNAIVNHIVPNVRFLQSPRITNNHEEELWSSESNIKSSFIKQKSKRFINLGFTVASHAVENDYIFFTALECVYGVHLNCLMNRAELVHTKLF